MFLKRFFAATPENPRFNLDDPNAWEAFLSGPPSSTGMNVSRESALTYSSWWRGINLLSADVAKLPLHLYKRLGAGKERDASHPAYYLLRREPNTYQTSFQFRRQLTGHALSTGNGYAYIFRGGDGRPLELLPLDPESTYPVRENGRKLYITQMDGQNRKLEAENVLHIPGFGYDGLTGYSVIEKARESLGLGMAARKYQAVQFKNSGRPSVVLETPGKLNDAATVALRASWERIHAGLDNAHKTAILHSGLTAKPLSFSNQDQELLLTRQFEIREVANWLGLPPHKVGDTTRTAYASLEQENLSYLTESLDPWLCVWEEECWCKLLTEEEKRADTHIVEFLRAALVRADLNSRGAYYRTSLGGAPWMTRNEVRGLENLNPVEGGDEILDPKNMGQGGADNEPTPPMPPTPPATPPKRSSQAGIQAVIEDAARRMVRRLAHASERAAKEPSKYLSWLATLGEHREVFEEAFAPAAMLLGKPAEYLAARLFGPIEQALFTAADTCTPAGLGTWVEGYFRDAELSMPSALARELTAN